MNFNKNMLSKLLFLFPLIFIPFLKYFNQNLSLPVINVSKQESALNLNKNFVMFLNLGNKRFFSSVLWIKTLLDSDLEHYKESDLNSWLYLRFKTIVTLDPMFKQAYQFGSLYLSIVKDDIYGAKELFELGLEKFPDDPMLNFNGGYHYYFELGDKSNAVKCFEKLLNKPDTPPFLPTLISRIKADTGDIENAYILLLSSYSKTNDERIKFKYDKALYALKAEIDLNCLNIEKKESCDKIDFHHKPYLINKNNDYSAQEYWEPFRPTKNPRK